ncbi:tubulin-specific chaperone A [Drosophila hydei]|uniref:Tubulin-specific chaperone A n=1 Tax=Drosophila hydei TaxID=7224 RepID=A0A6J1LJL8_DROHY|nr:tubulin-specific chaperone A [Drosophila hydei]
MADPRIRQLVIKTGVVKRLAKEKTVYEKEVKTEFVRLEKFKTDGADEHVIRKQEEVIQECQMMIPDSKRRLQKEFEVLQKYLQDEQDLKETEAYTKAAEMLSEAEAVLKS